MGLDKLKSLLDFCQKKILRNRQYLDFVAFGEGHPPFTLEKLNKQALEFFKAAQDFSAQFYPIVGHQGYLAWDTSECMGHLRNGYACGLISRDEFDDLAEYWLNQAHIFKNWGDLYGRLVSILLDNDTAWGSGMWQFIKKIRMI